MSYLERYKRMLDDTKDDLYDPDRVYAAGYYWGSTNNQHYRPETVHRFDWSDELKKTWEQGWHDGQGDAGYESS